MNMNPGERLAASLRGEAVDRPAVSFYEIDGYCQNPDDPGEFNIFNAPSWEPLLRLAREQSDSTVALYDNGTRRVSADPLAGRESRESWRDADGALFTRRTIRADTRALTSLTRRDPEINTVWTVEHLFKDADDLRAWLSLPEEEPRFATDPAVTLALEERVGEGGIVVQDCANALDRIALQFDMGTWTVMALTEQDLVMQALERAHRESLACLRAGCAALPGRLWRIVGEEIASEPYMPPPLFRKYAANFDRELVDVIHASGGWARIHCHGRLRNILGAIADTGCDAIDPIEPPHRGGDITLAEVRERYGDRWTLFGNIEITDIENLPAPEFEKKVATALREGVGDGNGRGFVLMPGACPYGRTITPLCLKNYERMVEMAIGNWK